MCTHILEIAEKICSRLAIIDRGRIVAMGEPGAICNSGETLDQAFIRLTERAVEKE